MYFSQYVFGPFLFILSFFMILLILVQRGKGGGLTGALGGPGGQSVFGSKAGDLFTRITIVVAAIWIFSLGFAVWWYNEASLSSALNNDTPTSSSKSLRLPSNNLLPEEPPQSTRTMSSSPSDASAIAPLNTTPDETAIPPSTPTTEPSTKPPSDTATPESPSNPSTEPSDTTSKAAETPAPTTPAPTTPAPTTPAPTTPEPTTSAPATTEQPLPSTSEPEPPATPPSEPTAPAPSTEQPSTDGEKTN